MVKLVHLRNIDGGSELLPGATAPCAALMVSGSVIAVSPEDANALSPTEVKVVERVMVCSAEHR